MIKNNDIIRWHAPKPLNRAKGGGGVCTRLIIAIHPGRRIAATIDPNPANHTAKIELYHLHDIELALKSGTGEFATVRSAPAKLTEGYKKYQDDAWKILDPFLKCPDSNYLFDCHERADLVWKAAKQAGCSEVHVREVLRRYLQGGRTKDGIRCSLGNCGKNPHRVLTKKQGRKDSLEEFRGKLNGIEMNDENMKKLTTGIKDHLRTTGNRHISLMKAFKSTLFDQFRMEVEIDGKKQLVFCEALPTKRQFTYFARKHFPAHEHRRSKMTAADHGTSVRAKISESRTLVPRGPGDIYQIDATTVDMYIISDNGKRKLLDRVTLYLVVDVWSYYVAGFHLTHGDACYEEAVLAVLSIIEDREEMCKRFGVPYDPTDWVKMPLCATLIGDRQECICRNSDLFMEKLGILITNPPPYRGDLKGFVEAGFGSMNKVLWGLPGGVDKDAAKDEEDYRLNAIYTFAELRRILFQEMIRLNRRFIPTIPVPPEAVLAEVEKVPVKLAAWGLENISGTGLSADLETVRRALLPLVDRARTTREGIRISALGVSGLLYRTEPGVLSTKYFEQGGGTDLKVQRDSRLVNVVWVTHPETRAVIPAYLSETKCAEYLGMNWAQARDWQIQLKKMAAQHTSGELPRDAAAYDFLNEQTDQAIDRALDQGPSTRSGVTDPASGETEKAREGELEQRPPLDRANTSEDDLF